MKPPKQRMKDLRERRYKYGFVPLTIWVTKGQKKFLEEYASIMNMNLSEAAQYLMTLNIKRLSVASKMREEDANEK